MKKRAICFLVGLFVLPVITSLCDSTNDFNLGEDINICSGDCYYANGSACGVDVLCFQSVSYDNGTLIEVNGKMDRNENIFNRTIGNSSVELKNITGSYNVQINCYSEDGWDDPINFQITISSATIVATSSNPSGSSYSLASIVSGDFDGIRKVYDEKIKRFWWAIMILSAFAIFLFFDMRKKKIDRITSKVLERMKKGGIHEKIRKN